MSPAFLVLMTAIGALIVWALASKVMFNRRIDKHRAEEKALAERKSAFLKRVKKETDSLREKIKDLGASSEQARAASNIVSEDIAGAVFLDKQNHLNRIMELRLGGRVVESVVEVGSYQLVEDSSGRTIFKRIPTRAQQLVVGEDGIVQGRMMPIVEMAKPVQAPRSGKKPVRPTTTKSAR